MDTDKLTKSMIVTILLPVVFLLVMCFHYIPKVLHEALGIFWLVLVMIHLYQKRQWFMSFRKGKWGFLRVVGTVINVLLILLVLIALPAGMGISNYLLSDIMPLEIQRSITIHQYHVSLPYAIMILSGLHWGLHWKGWLSQWNRVFNFNLSPIISRIIQGVLVVATFVVGIYGSFLNRVGDRLFMKHIFATEATNEPGAIYVLLLCGILGMYMVLGYMLTLVRKGSNGIENG